MSIANRSAAQTTAVLHQQYTTSTVLSKDGTTIGYRQYGHGPGIVLVQGAMGSAANFSQLADALSDAFTVYVPDRRGRGLSPLPFHQDHTIQRDVEDLDALLTKTGAHDVFALSSGAIIALTAAISSTAIRRLAACEPPLFARNPAPMAEVARYEKAIARGDVAAALTAAGKAVQLAPILNVMPNWLLTFFTSRILANDSKQPAGEYLPLRELAVALQYDFRDVTEMHGELQRFSAIQADVLLLGGGASPAYLKADLDALETVLPHVSRIEFPGLGHGASWNPDKRMNPGGKPEVVAQALRRFFA